MSSSGANSLFIRVLLDKKHALPYKVVDALVFHFIRLSNTYKARRAGDAEKLPVLWHQSLLVFCQRCVRVVSVLAFAPNAGSDRLRLQIRVRPDSRSERRAFGRHPREPAPADQPGGAPGARELG